jgi:hypothetical protein
MPLEESHHYTLVYTDVYRYVYTLEYLSTKLLENKGFID